VAISSKKHFFCPATRHAPLPEVFKERTMIFSERFEKAAESVKSAKAMIVTSGAGMGVDSGLPDFRGDQGFWKAYPMYAHLGISFIDAANPANFEEDPAFGWGFYGHRTNLYRETQPHRGFQMLQDWAAELGQDSFVVTSNVDGQFQKAGYREDQILEVHGSINHLQCLTPCCNDIWDNNKIIPWLSDRTRGQEMRFDSFLTEHQHAPIVVIEMGAGTTIPTIRYMSERIGQRNAAKVIRINPRESHIAGGHTSLPCGALVGLEGIDEFL
jgi:NAD-dependent SIR2 family protein deacetylase